MWVRGVGGRVWGDVVEEGRGWVEFSGLGGEVREFSGLGGEVRGRGVRCVRIVGLGWIGGRWGWKGLGRVEVGRVRLVGEEWRSRWWVRRRVLGGWVRVVRVGGGGVLREEKVMVRRGHVGWEVGGVRWVSVGRRLGRRVEGGCLRI